MSIKLNMIEVRGRIEKETVRVEAQLILRNAIEFPRPIIITADDVVLKEAIVNNEKNLRNSLIHYIYGDLLDPINEMAILAQHHLTGMNDADELKEHQKKINDIMKGL